MRLPFFVCYCKLSKVSRSPKGFFLKSFSFSFVLLAGMGFSLLPRWQQVP